MRDLLEQHLEHTDSAVAAALLGPIGRPIDRFTKALTRDYAAVLRTRQTAVDEGLDPDGDVVWTRILEVTGG